MGAGVGPPWLVPSWCRRPSRRTAFAAAAVGLTDNEALRVRLFAKSSGRRRKFSGEELEAGVMGALAHGCPGCVGRDVPTWVDDPVPDGQLPRAQLRRRRCGIRTDAQAQRRGEALPRRHLHYEQPSEPRSWRGVAHTPRVVALGSWGHHRRVLRGSATSLLRAAPADARRFYDWRPR
jgi:hypothetical protein